MSNNDFTLEKSVNNVVDTRKIEYINPNLLKPDPNQPRKEFDEDAIEKMAQTFKTQGVINPVEVDENNILITGEMRSRSAKKAGLERIPIIRLKGLDKDERRERQVVENLHHHTLKDIELENAVYEMYLSGRYGKPERKSGGKDGGTGTITKLAETIGYSVGYISQIIEAKEFRDRTASLFNKDAQPETAHLRETSSLPDEDRIKVLKAAEKGKMQIHGTDTLATVAKVYKESPNPIKEKLLRGEIGLDEAKKDLERERTQKLFVSSEEFQKLKREHDEAWAHYEEEIKKTDSNFGHVNLGWAGFFAPEGRFTVEYICKPLERFVDLDASILTSLDCQQKEKMLSVLLEARKKIDEMVKAIEDNK
jgi:hypothetical protein